MKRKKVVFLSLLLLIGLLIGTFVIQQKEHRLKLQQQQEEKINSYQNYFREAILNKRVVLEMSDEMVKMSWGSPQRINQTIGPWGTYQQWIYDSHYLYFENDILTLMWQNHIQIR